MAQIPMGEQALMTFQVRTEHSDREVSGYDTTILTLPPVFRRQLESGEEALDVVALSKALRALAETQAADLGEQLHHADFIITSDPEVVREKGILHDCDRCREGVRQAVNLLAQQPGHEMLVGSLYWAAQ